MAQNLIGRQHLYASDPIAWFERWAASGRVVCIRRGRNGDRRVSFNGMREVTMRQAVQRLEIFAREG